MLWTFSKSAQRLSHPDIGFGAWACNAKSVPVAGHTPIENGTYMFGPISYNEPEIDDTYLISEGPYFVSVNRTNEKGLHGGGTASPHPLAAQQGWYDTEGCIRVQNIDLYHIVLNLGNNDELQVTD